MAQMQRVLAHIFTAGVLIYCFDGRSVGSSRNAREHRYVPGVPLWHSHGILPRRGVTIGGIGQREALVPFFSIDARR